MVKKLPANAGDVRNAGSIAGSGISPGGGHGNPLQYSCLENHMDRGAWQTTIHRVAQSQTRLKRLSTRTRRTLTVMIFFSLKRHVASDGRRSSRGKDTLVLIN